MGDLRGVFTNFYDTAQQLLIDQFTLKMKSVYHAALRLYFGLVFPDFAMKDIYLKHFCQKILSCFVSSSK